MKLYDAGVTVAVILVIAILTGIASVKFLGKENVIEKIDEGVIKEETGVDIDLSSVEQVGEAIVNEVEGGAAPLKASQATTPIIPSK